jgi:plastocyanin
MTYAPIVAWTLVIGAMSLSSTAPGSAYAATPTSQKAAALTVHIKDYKFKPETSTVVVGDTVEFVNDDDDTHTATAVDGTFDSKGLGEKGRFSYTFTKPGTYHYGCKIHASMKGTIIVRPAGKDTQ